MYFCQATKALDELGMNNKIRGYNYSRSAICFVALNDFWVTADEIYLYVSKQFSTTPDCVERNIRYAIEKTWEKGCFESINSMFGYTVSSEKGKPTNSEFIFMIADRVRAR